jgi:hypothetical protein
VKWGEILWRNVLARFMVALDGQGVIESYIESCKCNNEHLRNVQTNVSQEHGMKAQGASKGKGKAFPLQAWTGPEDSRRLRLPDFKTVGT